MKVALLLVSLAWAEVAFYGREVELISGDMWKILSREEAGETGCDERCGDSCLQVITRESLFSYLKEDDSVTPGTLMSCLEFCGCKGTAVPMVPAPESVKEIPYDEAETQSEDISPISPSCAQQCVSLCNSQSVSCLTECTQEFCSFSSEDESSILLPVVIDLAVLALLLGMFYFAYVYTPKRQKRGAYWRKRIMEAQYTRLDDY